jgi:hypothetical protein
MKTLQFIACLFALTSVVLAQSTRPAAGLHLLGTPSPTPPPAELAQLLAEGKAAYAKGDIGAAKSAFQMAYQIDSRNQVAIGYLRRIQGDLKDGVASVPLERQLAGVMIPQIQFHDATLGSAIDYLKTAVNRQTNGRLSVNFVIQLPPEQVRTQTVTLSLTQVPFTEALKYLGTVANLTFDFQKYAVVVKSNGEAPVSTTSVTTTPATTTAPVPGTLPGQ